MIKGFIEVTENDRKRLINIAAINYVRPRYNVDGTFISIFDLSLEATESYDEVCKLITAQSE